MKEGDIILTPLPQANGKVKSRPAVFLRKMPPYEDLLVCGVILNYNSWYPILMILLLEKMAIF